MAGLKKGMNLFVRPRLRTAKDAGYRKKGVDKYLPYFSVEHAFGIIPWGSVHANAFKSVADTMIEQHLVAPLNNDPLVFPVLTLYRHCVELWLKDFVRMGLDRGIYGDDELKKILGEKRVKKVPGCKAPGCDPQIEEKKTGILFDHKLMPLWAQTMKLFRRYQEKPDDDEAIAGGLVNQIHQADPDGQTLRYDRGKGEIQVNRKGLTKRYEKIPATFDIVTFRDTMNQLVGYFSGWVDWIDLLDYEGRP